MSQVAENWWVCYVTDFVDICSIRGTTDWIPRDVKPTAGRPPTPRSDIFLVVLRYDIDIGYRYDNDMTYQRRSMSCRSRLLQTLFRTTFWRLCILRSLEKSRTLYETIPSNAISYRVHFSRKAETSPDHLYLMLSLCHRDA